MKKKTLYKKNYAIILQNVFQKNQTSNQNKKNVKSFWKNNKKNDKNQNRDNDQNMIQTNYDKKYENKKCLCDEMHLFRKCSYINKSNRSSDWKKNKKIKNIMKKKFRNNKSFFNIMKKISNINFLNEISDSSNDESDEKKTNKSNDKNSSFLFANMIYIINKIKSHNSFHNNVIYDFKAEEHLTFKMNRFQNEIRFASNDQWMNISNDSFIITGYKTMMIRNILIDRSRELLFDNIVYVSDFDIILMSANVFQDKRFFWKMNDNSMFNKKTDQKTCMLEKHFDSIILKFNVMFSNLLINAVQFCHFEKTISWIWHLKLNHCRFEIIQRFKKLNEIEMLIDEISKIVNCETCAISKMHEMINCALTVKIIRSFEILHFDIVINSTEFDEIKCIAHFTNEFISYSWIYFFINHKKATLLSVFKSLIN